MDHTAGAQPTLLGHSTSQISTPLRKWHSSRRAKVNTMPTTMETQRFLITPLKQAEKPMTV